MAVSHLGHIAPYVHLGGTSKEALERQLEIARSALAQAIDALDEAAPNARDYFGIVPGPAHFDLATSQHRFRRARLDEVLAELDDIAEAVADQA